MNPTNPVGDEGEGNVGEETYDDAVGDAAADGHEEDGEEGGEGLDRVGEVDVAHGTEEVESRDDHHRGCGGIGNGQEQGRQEQTAYETQGDDKGREACATAFGNARCTLDVGGHGAASQTGACNRSEGIAEHDVAHVGDTAVFTDGTGLGHQTDDGAEGIEQVEEQHGEHADPQVGREQLVPDLLMQAGDFSIINDNHRCGHV